MIQKQRQDQHQLISHHGVNIEPYDALMNQEQHHDQHQFMSHQRVNTDTYSEDDSFFSEFNIEKLQELHDI